MASIPCKDVRERRNQQFCAAGGILLKTHRAHWRGRNRRQALYGLDPFAEAYGLSIEWKQGLAENLDDEDGFDIAYARFVLSHLRDPEGALRRMRRAVRRSGKIIVEDMDITTHAHWPPIDAFHRYIELYAATGRARGVDPVIGPRLAAMLIEAGLENVEVSISMPVFRDGEGKTIARLTLSNIADAAISSGLTDRAEVDCLLAELATHEADPRSIQSTAQVFQAIGRCP